ncbi:SpoIID/LytB domain-containing protein [Candidatus Gottesmanbacteria bacterium]|nr:SpoIID/LytB domain-containing protein [Candidatus Gottesmanbacteria bacterium]
MRKIFLSITLFTFYFLLFTSPIHADELSDIEKQLGDLKRALQQSIAATTPLEKDLNKLKSQLDAIKNRTITIEKEVIKRGKELDEGASILAAQQEVLEKKVRNYYKNSLHYGPFLLQLLLGKNLDLSIREFGYQKKVVNTDRDTIVKIVLYITDLEEKKRILESEKSRLVAIKAETDKQASFLDQEIKGAKAYQSNLSSQIATLTARQQNILAQRLSSLHISRSASSLGRCDSDLTNGRDPGFSPRFAAFTYGVPNRVGLNQWGAYGRAKQGQGFDAILRSYYNFDDFQNFDVNIQINVEGHGTFNLEDYVKRIYEVPGDWPSEVLKAQAIAARSYALAYTNNGSGPICATESCQVFKPDPKGGAWEQAVNDTSGKVMVQGGKPIKAWYSSTHGGYVFDSGSIGWNSTSWTKNATDTQGSVSSFSDLTNNSFDKESPWFYCDWGSRSEYNKTAWLKGEEFADIVNILMLVKIDSGTAEHLYQTDKPNPAGTDTWDKDRAKQELKNRGGNPYNNISNITISADFGSGRTTTVNVDGDAGGNTFDGGEFKNYFNLRAPANIQIVGPLYNIERR